MSKKLLVIAAVVLFASSIQAVDLPAAAGLTIDEIINKIQSNQSKIKDMYAETTTIITSNMVMPGQESKGPQKITQKSKMWTKGEDKSKIEMLSPTRQITITNGDQMAIIDPETGQKTVQDMSKIKGQMPGGKGQGSMNLDKAKEFFYFSARKITAATAGGSDTYIITGVPKQQNRFMGKMEFYVDSEKWLPTKIMMYDPKNKPMSQTEIEYSSVEDGSATAAEGSVIFVQSKNKSVISSPMGKMEVGVEYGAVKINSGISDDEFTI
ncbi:MAG: outer membrane lipoprotein-sorting protein [Candidatus Margulisiibacteriota bacterium]